MQIIVSLVGHQVAAAAHENTAARQIGQMVDNAAHIHISQAGDKGDFTSTVKIRTVLVELDRD